MNYRIGQIAAIAAAGLGVTIGRRDEDFTNTLLDIDPRLPVGLYPGTVQRKNKRDPQKPHTHSREIERRLRQQARREAKRSK